MNIANTLAAIAPVYMGAPEAAQYLCIGFSTINKLRLTGRGPRYSKRGRRVLYSRADLDAWVAEGQRSSTSDSGEG